MAVWNPSDASYDSSTDPASSASSGAVDLWGLSPSLQKQTVFLGTVSTPHPTGELDGGPRGKVISTSPYGASAQDLAKNFAGGSVTNPQQYAALQQQLYNAGFYGATAKPPRAGAYLAADKSAFSSALQQYLAVVNPDDPNPITFGDFLDRLSGQGSADLAHDAAAGGGGGGRAPLSLTDPATLRQTLQSAAQNALHRNLSDDELSHFVNAFHSKEAGAYGAAGGGATYTSPDAGAEAIEQVQTDHSAEAGQALTAGYLDTLKTMLGVTASGSN